MTLVCLSAAFAIPSLPPAALAAGECGATWSLAPGAAARNINGISALSVDDVWAVGVASGLVGRTFAEHWDGSSWVRSDTPNVGARENGLNDVSAVSADDIWAVGFDSGGTEGSGGWTPLIEHWDGTTWAVVDSNTRKGADSLTGVAAVSSNDVWAVGFNRSGAGFSSLVEHWDGHAWRIVEAPSPPGSVLLSVTALNATQAWAVGFRMTEGGHEPFVIRWDGAGWSRVEAPQHHSTVLTSVAAGLDNDVWAAGYSTNGGWYRTVAEHWDGSTWTITPTPNRRSTINVLLGVAAVSGTGAWAVGASFDAASFAYHTLILHWDGSAWSIEQSPDGPGKRNELISIAAAPDAKELFAGGRAAGTGLIETKCPESPAAPPNHGDGPSVPTGPWDSSDTGTHSLSGLPSPPELEAHRAASSVRARQNVIAVDEAASAGIAQITPTHGVVVADFNGDAWPDLFLGRHQNPPALYLNDRGGHLVEVDQGQFGSIDRHDCAAGDVNVDGRPDLFCPSGANKGSEIKRNQLFLQGADETFTDETEAYGLVDPFGRGWTATFLDVNHDRYPDLFLGAEGERPDGLPTPDRLYINRHGRSFADRPGLGMDSFLHGNCESAGDVDGDSWQDLLVCTDHGLRLYRNDHGTHFSDVTAVTGLGQPSSDAAFMDLNDDGLLDVATVAPDRLTVLFQAGGSFTPVYDRSLRSGKALALGDVNGDGATDIYVLQASDDQSPNEPDLMLLNDGSGRSYTKMPIPETTAGHGDDVAAMDYDGNGLSDFVVTNGGELGSGPVQLIAFFQAG